MIFFEKALFVFKFKLKMLPDQFSNYLTEAIQVYEKFTRASGGSRKFWWGGILSTKPQKFGCLHRN